MAPVGGPVVGHDRRNGDPLLCEPGDGPVDESDGGVAFSSPKISAQATREWSSMAASTKAYPRR